MVIMKISKLGEFGLIEALAQKIPLHSDRVIKGIGDDTAVLSPEPGKLLLMTTDMIVEDIHFSLSYCSLHSVGWKAMAVNISDIAAMGGEPSCAVISVSIPPDWGMKQAEDLYAGLIECAREYETDIVGGDTVHSTGGLTVNAALLGYVESDRVVYRSGACPGDVIMVTGPLGGSAAGLYVLNHSLPDLDTEFKDEVTALHLYPRARVREGRVLGDFHKSGDVGAMNDISDGLAGEVLEICKAGGTGCELYENDIPFSLATAAIGDSAGVSPLKWALYGGEDFELVFTVKPDSMAKVASALREIGRSSCTVGKITTPDRGYLLVGVNNGLTELEPGGYNHFVE